DDTNRARPMFPFQKTAEAGLHSTPRRLFNELIDIVSHDRGVGKSRHLRYTFIYGAYGSIERNRASRVFKRVNQFLEAALRALDHLAKLVQLRFRGRRAHVLLQSMQECLKF